MWNMPWNSIPDSVSQDSVAEDVAPTSESADSAEKGELALPLMASLDLAAAHVADAGLEPNGMTGSLEMDPVWVKRSKLAHEFGIRKMHFVPVAGGVLECGTPSTEDMVLQEYLGLMTSEMLGGSQIHPSEMLGGSQIHRGSLRSPELKPRIRKRCIR